ncbi:MAG: hypothetical protein ACLFUE_05720 [Desulfobacteraceae bacterium]
MGAVTVYSNAVLAGVTPDHCIPAGVVLSRTGYYKNTATSAALDQNSVIQLIPMPAGAQLLDLIIVWSALGASRTLDVGIGDDVDMFFDGLDAEHAGNARLGGALVNNAADDITMGDSMLVDVYPYEFTANDTIDVKVLGADFPDDAELAGVAIYKQEGAIADET